MTARSRALLQISSDKEVAKLAEAIRRTTSGRSGAKALAGDGERGVGIEWGDGGVRVGVSGGVGGIGPCALLPTSGWLALAEVAAK